MFLINKQIFLIKTEKFNFISRKFDEKFYQCFCFCNKIATQLQFEQLSSFDAANNYIAERLSLF